MGGVTSRVGGDSVLAEKLKRRKPGGPVVGEGSLDDQEELEQQVELRRKNSLACAIEDYMEDRVPDSLPPQLVSQ